MRPWLALQPVGRPLVSPLLHSQVTRSAAGDSGHQPTEGGISLRVETSREVVVKTTPLTTPVVDACGTVKAELRCAPCRHRALTGWIFYGWWR
jgi:hypothetical protein